LIQCNSIVGLVILTLVLVITILETLITTILKVAIIWVWILIIIHIYESTSMMIIFVVLSIFNFLILWKISFIILVLHLIMFILSPILNIICLSLIDVFSAQKSSSWHIDRTQATSTLRFNALQGLVISCHNTLKFGF
jgi:hypothetical protein